MAINVNDDFHRISAKIAKKGGNKNACFAKMNGVSQELYLSMVETAIRCTLINTCYRTSKKNFWLKKIDLKMVSFFLGHPVYQGGGITPRGANKVNHVSSFKFTYWIGIIDGMHSFVILCSLPLCLILYYTIFACDIKIYFKLSWLKISRYDVSFLPLSGGQASGFVLRFSFFA